MYIGKFSDYMKILFQKFEKKSLKYELTELFDIIQSGHWNNE